MTEYGITVNSWFVFLFYTLAILITVGFSWILIKEIRQTKKNERQLQNYIDLNEHTPICTRNMQDEIISWNNGTEKLYGWSEKEVIGKISHELFSAVFPRPLDEIKKFLLFNNHWLGELKHTLRNNTLIDVSSHWSLVRDENGYATVIMETINDITGLKKKEKVIASLSAVLNKLNDAIYTVNVAGKIQTWNKGSEKLYGYTVEKAIGQHSNEFLKTKTSTSDIDQIVAQMNGQDHWLGELIRKTKTGKDIFVHVSAGPIREKDGTITGYISGSHDITDKIILREQLTYLANLVDYSADAIISVIMDGKIISWDKGAVTMYGYETAQAIGKSVFMILPSELINEEKVIIEKIKKGIVVHDFETQRLKKDGSRIAVSLTISPVINNDGELIAVSGITRDISARKYAEKQIIESEENQKAIFDNTSEGFVLADINGIIKASNKRAQKSILSNIDKTIVAGRSVFEFIEPSRADFFKKTFSAVLSGKTIHYDHF